MANVFPEIEPDICRRGWTSFAKMVRAANGSPSFNIPHPYIPASFHLEWGSVLPTADRKTLVAHWKANVGLLFTFFDFTADNGLDEVSIGTGNGAQTIFTLPAKSTSGRTIKKAGVTQTEGTAYSYSAGSGAEGEDRITFTVAPSNGQAITAAATTGRRRHYVVCVTLKIDEEHVEGDIWKHVIDLEEKVPIT